MVDQPAAEQEVEIAPILGRKKKQRKEKPLWTGGSGQSRSETPMPQPLQPTLEEESIGEDHHAPAAGMTDGQEEEPRSAAAPDTKGKGKAPAIEEEDTAAEAHVPPETPSPEKPELSAYDILQELCADGHVAAPEEVSLLKPFPGLSYRWDGLDLADDLKRPFASAAKVITEDELNMLHEGKAVRKTIDAARALLTPNGDCVHCLTEEEEDRFLELQARVAESANTPEHYVHSRHEPSSGFSLIKGRAVPNGPPSYFPRGWGTRPADPLQRMQREDALTYINQWVLPHLGLGCADMSKMDLVDAGAAHAKSLSALAPMIYESERTAAVTGAAAATAATRAGSSSRNGELPALLSTSEKPLWTAHPDELPALLREMSGGEHQQLALLDNTESEIAIRATKKEAERLEKSLNQLIKRNRRLLLSPGGGH